MTTRPVPTLSIQSPISFVVVFLTFSFPWFLLLAVSHHPQSALKHYCCFFKRSFLSVQASFFSNTSDTFITSNYFCYWPNADVSSVVCRTKRILNFFSGFLFFKKDYFNLWNTIVLFGWLVVNPNEDLVFIDYGVGVLAGGVWRHEEYLEGE